MSVIIKTAELSYRDKLGNYHGVNAVAEKKISDQISDLNTAILAQESRISGDISQMSTDIGTQETRISGDLSQMGTDITAQETRISGDLSQMSTDIGTQETRISGDLSQMGTDITAQETRISGDLSQMNTTIGNQETRITQIVTQLRNDVGEAGTVVDAVEGLKALSGYFEDVFSCGKKWIENASIDSSGVVVAETGRNLVCFRVTAGVYTTVTGNFELFGLFTTEPALGSVTYNTSRTVSSVLNGLKIPAGCTWVALRTYPQYTDQAITPVTNIDPVIQQVNSDVGFNRYSDYRKRYIPVSGFQASSITRTAGKLITRDGRTVTNSDYSIATFTADASKTYLIRWKGGDGYTVTRGVELLKSSTVIGYCVAESSGSSNETVIHNFSGTVRCTYRSTSDSDFTVTYCEEPNNAIVSSFNNGIILGDFTKFYTIDFFPYSNNIWDQHGHSVVIELNDAITSITLNKDANNIGMVLTYCNKIFGIAHAESVDYVSPGRVVTTASSYSVQMDTGAKYVVIALDDGYGTDFFPGQILVNGHDVSSSIMDVQGQTVSGIIFDDDRVYSSYFGHGGTGLNLTGATGANKNTIVAPQSCTLVSDTSTFHDNSALGYHAMYGIRSGYHNTAIGSEALDRPTGNGNTAVGFYACAGRNDNDSTFSPSNYNNNTGIGKYAMTYARDSANTAVGAMSLFGLHKGYCNVALGYYAGAYLDSEYTPYDPDHSYTDYSRYLFIDGLDRENRNNMFTKSMIVGRFNTDPANQTLQFNSKVGFNGATPQGKQTVANEATDLSSAITLLNSIRTILINVGLAQAST